MIQESHLPYNMVLNVSTRLKVIAFEVHIPYSNQLSKRVNAFEVCIPYSNQLSKVI